MSTQCCPDCSPYCQDINVALAQTTGGDDWWGAPFEDGIDAQALVFASDGCCARCESCPTCQGW